MGARRLGPLALGERLRFGTVCEVVAARWRETPGDGRLDVRRAPHPVRPDERLVVKRLLPHLEQDATAVALVVREASILRSLPSPPAPNLVAADLEARAPWFAMRLIEGAPLEEARRIHGLTGVSCAVAEAVVTLHAGGETRAIAHGDLKPAHVRIAAAADGCVAYVMDYGNARRSHEDAPVPPEPTGTPAYLAPERCAGQAPSAAADVYAVALMIAELSRGEKFHGDRERAMKAVADLDGELRRLLEAALAPSPEARPSAAELARGMRRSGPPPGTLPETREAHR